MCKFICRLFKRKEQSKPVPPPTTTTTTSTLLYAASRFSFNNTGATAICVVPTSPAYYVPSPILLDPPLFIYQDAAGTIPFSNSFVNDNVSGLPSPVYSYNSSTGAVGSQVSTCL